MCLLFQLQLLEGDRLDLGFNDEKMKNGNEVRMGVELDPFEKAVAYHLLDRHPSDLSVRFLRLSGWMVCVPRFKLGF